MLSLVLVDAKTGSQIRPLKSGDVFARNDLLAQRATVVALTSKTTARVVFDLNNIRRFRDEKARPFGLTGDRKGGLVPWSPGVGPVTITAIPYNAKGGRGAPRTVRLNITESQKPDQAIAELAPQTGAVKTAPAPAAPDPVPGAELGAMSAPAPNDLAKKDGRAAFDGSSAAETPAPVPATPQKELPTAERVPQSETKTETDSTSSHDGERSPAAQSAPPAKVETSGEADCRGLFSARSNELTVVCSHSYDRAQSAYVLRTDTKERSCDFAIVTSPMITKCPASPELMDALRNNRVAVRFQIGVSPDANDPVIMIR